MSDTTTLLDRHDHGAPTWVHRDLVTHEPSGDATACSPETAARALCNLDPIDRRLLILSHGLGFRLGPVSYATRVDPALVTWHLQRAIDGAAKAAGVEADDLEAAIHALLTRDDHADVTPAPPEGEGASWRAAELLRHFPEDEISRLTARVVHNVDSNTLEESNPGLGVGAIAFVGVVVAAFMIYGALRDVNPVWQGTRLMQLGQYDEARRVLSDYARMTKSGEAATKVILCWLAEGDFDEAFRELSEHTQLTANFDPEANHPLGAFRPNDAPLEFVGGDPDCPAVLPRGLITNTRPPFVFLSREAGTLELNLIPKVGTEGDIRTVTVEVEPTSQRFTRITYPSHWAPIPPGAASWSAPGVETMASFTVLETTRTRKLMNRARLGLPPSTPEPAKYFLRGHFYLRHELYQQAAEQFAWLVQEFPDERYPSDQLDLISDALGVDRKVFLR